MIVIVELLWDEYRGSEFRFVYILNINKLRYYYTRFQYKLINKIKFLYLFPKYFKKRYISINKFAIEIATNLKDFKESQLKIAKKIISTPKPKKEEKILANFKYRDQLMKRYAKNSYDDVLININKWYDDLEKRDIFKDYHKKEEERMLAKKLKEESVRKNNWWVQRFKILQYKEEYKYFEKLKKEKKKKKKKKKLIIFF